MPCNLVGQYVTIVADYSDVTPPYEIALCSWGILGDGIPIPDEVTEPELEPVHVPPTFAEGLQPSSVVLNEASSWILPEVIIGSVALEEILVIPGTILKNSIDYDA